MGDMEEQTKGLTESAAGNNPSKAERQSTLTEDHSGTQESPIDVDEKETTGKRKHDTDADAGDETKAGDGAKAEDHLKQTTLDGMVSADDGPSSEQTKSGREESGGSAESKKESKNDQKDSDKEEQQPVSKKAKVSTDDKPRNEPSKSSTNKGSSDSPADTKMEDDSEIPDALKASTTSTDSRKTTAPSNGDTNPGDNAHLDHPENWTTGGDPATSKQIGYLKVLESQKGLNLPDLDNIGKSEASDLIDKAVSSSSNSVPAKSASNGSTSNGVSSNGDGSSASTGADNGLKRVDTNPSDPSHLDHPENWATGGDPATSKQIGYIKVLEKQKGVSAPVSDNLGKSEASEVIEDLKKQ